MIMNTLIYSYSWFNIPLFLNIFKVISIPIFEFMVMVEIMSSQMIIDMNKYLWISWLVAGVLFVKFLEDQQTCIWVYSIEHRFSNQ